MPPNILFIRETISLYGGLRNMLRSEMHVSRLINIVTCAGSPTILIFFFFFLSSIGPSGPLWSHIFFPLSSYEIWKHKIYPSNWMLARRKPPLSLCTGMIILHFLSARWNSYNTVTCLSHLNDIKMICIWSSES